MLTKKIKIKKTQIKKERTDIIALIRENLIWSQTQHPGETECVTAAPTLKR